MDIAARVRATELRSLQLNLDDDESRLGDEGSNLAEDDMRKHALKTLDERGGAQELVRQQYSGRYPFELLQNADDAAREGGRRGRARFVLTNTALLVADDGSGFGEQQVKAICSLGRSPKGPGSSIGHKGLGFKSVGEITDNPQVISIEEQFQFDASRVHVELKTLFGTLPTGQRFPTYAFPYPLSRDDLAEDAEIVDGLRADGFTTVVRLPLKQEVDRSLVEVHLTGNLDARLLIFLPSIDHLELRGTQHDFSADVVRESIDGVERVLLIEAESAVDEEWLVYRSSIVPSEAMLAPLGDDWADLTEVKLAVAVPLDTKTGQPLLDEKYPLHVYFPTEEEPGLRVAVHAEWVLSMDRTRIAHTPEATEFNRRLHEAVTEFVADKVASDLVRRCDLSPESVQSLLPDRHVRSGDAAHEFADLWKHALARVSLLPLVSGRLGRANDVRLLPAHIRDIPAAHGFADLSPDATLRADIEAVEEVVHFVVAVGDDPVMTDAEFLQLLNPPKLTAADEFYTFLLEWYDESPTTELLDELKIVKCVFTNDGKVLNPTEQPIFFPRRDASLPDDLPVPIAYVPEIPGIDRLLRDLDVKSFQWRDIINEYLIKILEREDTDPVERDRAMRGLRAYQEVRTTAGDVASENLGRVLLPARKRTGDEITFRPANKTYFPSEWTGSNDLEEIYGPFDEAEFLGVAPPIDRETLDRERSFYQMLGVIDHPRVEAAGNSYKLDGYRKHAHSGPRFTEWLAAVDAHKCGQGHDRQYLMLSESLRLDRQEELADSTDPRRLAALWKELARNWVQIYEPAMYVTVDCNHRYHNGSRTRSVLSLFGYNLIFQPWVPVEIADELDFSRPSEAWVDTAIELPAHIRRRIPLVSQTMYRTKGAPNMVADLGMIETTNPKVEDYLRILEGIAEEADATGTVSRDIARAARWVQRKINDGLSTDDLHPSPQNVRVLAKRGEDILFAAQPVYASDPALRSTWDIIAPVMVADSGDIRFAKYLGLLKLDDAVDVSPVPRGERRDGEAVAIARRIGSAKPFIVALIHQNARTENRIVRILGSLELVFCERLHLVYRYGDEEIEVDSAPCFVAVREASEGNRRGISATAYVVLDQQTSSPDWFAFGRQLADRLDISPHADAITMLLKDDSQDRERLMMAREISLSLVSEAAAKLDLDSEEDPFPSVLDQLLDQPSQVHTASLDDGDLTPTLSAPTEVHEVQSQSNERPIDVAEPSTTPPPPINYSAVRMVDATPQMVDEHRDGGGRSRDRVAATRNTIAPSMQTESEKRRIGKRGEEVAYNKERERLREIGLNPDSVVWHSATDELAPFDILSFDPDGQRIYIEVKATPSSNPSEPFYISKPQLIEAGVLGDRYYIYRVTDVDTEEPVVTRYINPWRLVKSGRARLTMAKAQMEIGAPEPDA